MFVTSLALSVRFFSAFPFSFTFSLLCICSLCSLHFLTSCSDHFSSITFEIKIKFSHLLFYTLTLALLHATCRAPTRLQFQPTTQVPSPPLTRFPFSACPVGGWVTESACRFIYNAGRYWFSRHICRWVGKWRRFQKWW